MRKLFISCWLVFILPLYNFGQSLDLKWAKQTTVPNTSSISNKGIISIDNSGNTYQAGSFSGTTIFEPGVSLTTSSRGAFLLKRNSEGNLQWLKQISSTGSISCDGIHTDNTNNTIITGWFVGNCTFSSTTILTSTTGSLEGFIAKYDTNGNFLWAKKIGSNYEAKGLSVSSDNVGNVYTIGVFSQQVDFIPGRRGFSLFGTSPYWESYIAKYDINGNFLWAKKIGGYQVDGYDLTVDNAQNIYVVGVFNNSIDFGSGVTLSSTGMFYAKYNNLGNILWAKRIGSTGVTHNIELDNSNNIYLAGNFNSSTLNVGSITLSNNGGISDIFFGKFDNSGNPIWVKNIGGTGQDVVNAMKLDNNGNIYLGGAIGNSVNFGITTLTTNGAQDGFVAKYNNNGNIQYTEQMGRNNNEFDGINTLAIDNIGNVWIGGFFSGTCYLNATTTMTIADGNADIFLAKYFQTPEINVKNENTNIISGGNFSFGNVLVGETNSTTFTIENTGSTVLNVAISSNTPEFIVNSNISSVNPNSSATFTVSFSPTSVGNKNGQISITNNDPNENPYIISVQGNSVSPEINVRYFLPINNEVTNILNNGTLNMSTLRVVGETDMRRIQIQNIGTAPLKNISVEVIGADFQDFKLYSIPTPNSTINTGSSVEFQVEFDPSKMGLHTAQLKITNSDIDENPYIINLTGIGLTPDINLKQGSINIASGGNIVLPSVLAGELSETIVTIENLGNDVLNIGTINILGNTGEFQVNNMPTSIPVGGQANFQVRFTPPFGATGVKNITLNLFNNDFDENPYVMTISATIVEPEINVREGNVNIPHQTVFDMGTITEAGFGGTNAPIQKTLIIENIGLGDLFCPSNFIKITPITVGTEPNTFTTNQPHYYTALTSGENTSIIVTFTPTYTLNSATFRAVLEIKSNDSDENPYRIILDGKWQVLQGLDPNMLNIYPNPSPDGIFNGDFTSNLEEQFLVEILNQQLQTVEARVFTKSVGTQPFSINISNQPSGNYTMRLTSSQGRITKQIIKQ